MSAEAERLLEQATPLPWRQDHDSILTDATDPRRVLAHTGITSVRRGVEGDQGFIDAALIVYAVNRLPDYERAVRHLERLLAVSFHFYDCPWNHWKEREGAPCTCGVDAVAADAREALARLRESEAANVR